MLAAILEPEIGTGDEILDRARHAHLPRACERRDAGADRDRDTGDLAVGDHAFTGVTPGSDFDLERPERVPDRRGGENCAGGPVERCKESVAGRVELQTCRSDSGGLGS